MPKKILLADDSITIQKVVELTFSDGDYEVSAVNNGAKAIQKLSEMRPDIILSDIIMPEKNGYEVCEFVKSHPDYRNIPVVLLTGTFEPFDPDRADKAGCDAVVTKPFESQSLIQKVEELIAQAQAAPAPAAPEPEPEQPAAYAAEPSPWEEEPPATFPPPSMEPVSPEPFATGFQTHEADIFGSTPSSPAETPFDSGAFGGETRAFPRMSFEELQQMAHETPAAPPPAPPAPEPSPWDVPPQPESPWETQMSSQPPSQPSYGGETRAFPRMSFEELQQMATPTPAPEPVAPEPPVTPEPSPWDAGPLESGAAGDTMSPFAAEEPPLMPEPQASPWDEAPSFGGETRAFPRMSFEEMQQMAANPAPEPEPEPVAPPQELQPEPTPWQSQPEPEALPWETEAQPQEEAPSFGGETRAFPRMSFEEMQQMSVSTEAAPAEASPWDEPAASPFEATTPSAPAWTPAEEPSAAESFTTEAASPFAESLEQQEAPFEPEMTAPPAAEEPMWSPAQAEPQQMMEEVAPEPPVEAEAFPTPVNSQITDAVAPPMAIGSTGTTGAIPAATADLTDEQVDRIARRVVQLMSEQVVKNIAWEVIPDLAEMVVKERIRQLESEA